MQIAWLDCPFGRINDPSPGLCNRYVDSDGNDICDHSEPAPSDRVEISQGNNEYNADRVIDPSREEVDLDSGAINKVVLESEPANLSIEQLVASNSNIYLQKYMWGVFIPIAVYFVYWYLVERAPMKQKHIFLTQKSFRFFWNVVLLTSFLVTGITGILMLTSPSRSVSETHKYSGLVMLVTAALHIVVRWHYFKIVLVDAIKKEKSS
ncbi:DUF4405 domain-containing protein [Patescibacteria group bacterium]|nr:DUF4405 domain-containing protein [Patescibacteria group bacterium]